MMHFRGECVCLSVIRSGGKYFCGCKRRKLSTKWSCWTACICVLHSKEIENVKVRCPMCACAKTRKRRQNHSHEKSKLQTTRSKHQRQNIIISEREWIGVATKQNKTIIQITCELTTCLWKQEGEREKKKHIQQKSDRRALFSVFGCCCCCSLSATSLFK